MRKILYIFMFLFLTSLCFGLQQKPYFVNDASLDYMLSELYLKSANLLPNYVSTVPTTTDLESGQMVWYVNGTTTRLYYNLNGTIGYLAGDTTTTTTVNFDSSMTSEQIQALIDAQPKYIPFGKDLILKFADGTYTLNAPISFNGFFGGGSMFINGDETISSESTAQAVILNFSGSNIDGVKFFNNNVYIKMVGVRIIHKTDTTTTCGIWMNMNSLEIEVSYNSISGTSTTDGKNVYMVVSKSTLYQNYFSNVSIAIQCGTISNLVSHFNDDTGTMPKYGLWADYGGEIYKFDASQPDGSVADETVAIGGEIR